jgi:uncharacterized damage-inducible protein DinB
MTDESALPTPAFGWWDMWTDPESDPREDGGPYSGERETLVRYLRDHRLTLELKCAGLDAEAMARRSVPPSSMSLLGLVRHLTDVERHWLREGFGGGAPESYYGSTNRAFDEARADPAEMARAWDRWRAEVAFADGLVASAASLDVRGKDGTELRDVLLHLIEEYARHLGHADLLRERIDGRVGQ